MLAIREAARAYNVSPQHNNFLILSLGTGSSQGDEMVPVGDPNSWGVLKWLSPIWPEQSAKLTDVFMAASADMVDIYTSLFFHGSTGHENFLRIQYNGLKYKDCSTDNSSHEYLEMLERVANDLLKEPVSCPVHENIKQLTNEEALTV